MEETGGGDPDALQRKDLVLNTEDSINLVLQAQFNGIHHYQSMARGVLGATFAVIAISIAAVSTFYFPFPSLETESTAYVAVIEAVPLPIGIATAQFTVGISVLLSVAFLILSLTSLGISLNNVIDILLTPDHAIHSINVQSISERPHKIIQLNRDKLDDYQDMFMRSGLRLIFSVLMAVNSLLLYHLATSKSLWYLFWLNIAFMLPSVISKSAYKHIISKTIVSSEGVSLLEEAFTEDEGRWNILEVRTYERWLISTVGFLSFLVLLSWILPSAISIIEISL